MLLGGLLNPCEAVEENFIRGGQSDLLVSFPTTPHISGSGEVSWGVAEPSSCQFILFPFTEMWENGKDTAAQVRESILKNPGSVVLRVVSLNGLSDEDQARLQSMKPLQVLATHGEKVPEESRYKPSSRDDEVFGCEHSGARDKWYHDGQIIGTWGFVAFLVFIGGSLFAV